jgi:geranylgeranyl diphosphate synthase type II
VAGASTEELARIARYGEHLGLAFQIADDILDTQGETVAGEGAESGRNERRKATYPSIVGVVQARERLKELLQLCLEDLAPFGMRAVPLRAIAQHIIARAIKTSPKVLTEEINT